MAKSMRAAAGATGTQETMTSPTLQSLIERLNQAPFILPNEQVIWAPRRATPEAIAQVENALGQPIAGALREFLLLRGGGGLKSLPLSGIDPLHPLARNRGSILGDTLHWRAHGMPGRYIAIQRDAADQAPLCLDAQGGSEPPVIRWASGQAQPVASGFIDFYAASLEPLFRQAGI